MKVHVKIWSSYLIESLFKLKACFKVQFLCYDQNPQVTALECWQNELGIHDICYVLKNFVSLQLDYSFTQIFS